MNPGQEMFSKFLKGLVKEGRERDAETILQECFRLQEEGKFTPAVMAEIMPRMFDVVRPECVQQLKEAASHFNRSL